MSNNNNWKKIGGFSRTGTQNYVRTNDAAMGGTTFGSTEVLNNTGNTTMHIGNNAGVVFINGDIDMSGGPGIAAPINRVRNVRDPIANQDVATKYYVDRVVQAIQTQNQQIGPPGPEGPPGIGYSGQNGTDGSTGPTGVTGPIGPPGRTEGVLGPTGADGAKGATGSNGSAGATGAIGPVGAQGAKGEQGQQGIQGSNGTILWLNPDGDSETNELIIDSYLLSQFPIQSSIRTVGPISVSSTYGNVNKMIPSSRFWNNAKTISSLSVIPSGVWVLNLYAAVPSNSDANQVSIYAALFMITGTQSQPSPDSLVIETKNGGDAGYYPPREEYLPDHVKYIGRSWETSTTAANTQNVLTSNTTGVIITSTAKNLYKVQMPVDFVTLKDASGNANNVYLQLQLYVKNTKISNQTANVILYYQTNPDTSETTYSYLQTTFGAVGSVGPTGTPGSIGPPGSAGTAGATGPRGMTGQPGPTGTTGARGPAGPQGGTGPTGPAGQSNSFGPKYSVQYRSNTAPLGETDASGSFGGTTNFRYDASGYQANASDASMGTVVMNDLACKSVHSSFYIEDPSITGSTRPRTFVKGGELGSNYVVLASGKDTLNGGATNSPGTTSDITHGIKLIHNIDAGTPTATINLHHNSKTSGKIGVKFDLTTGDVISGTDQFCILNSSGRVGIGGIAPSELTAVSGLNRALHICGNVMVGTHPATPRSTTATSAMIMLNEATSAPTTKDYPGMYHRGVLSTTSTTLGLQDSSGGLGITAPNFITLQTGDGATQSNSIVINSAGDVSVLGRANLNGRVSVGKNFEDTSSYGLIPVKSVLDISGTTHMSSAATSFTDNPRIKLISGAVNPAFDIPNFTQSANEISGVNTTQSSGFLRLTAQTPANSCIDLIGTNSHSNGSKYNNSVRIATGGAERMLIDGNGNIGVGTNIPGVRLDVAGGAARVNSGATTSTALTTTGRVGVNNASPGTDLDVTGVARVTAASTTSTALTTTGRIGINQATPTVDLDITGAARVNSGATTSTALTTTGRIGINQATPTVDLDITGTARVNSGATTSTALTTTGRIGINQATPTVDLDITGTARVNSGATTSTALTTTGRIGINQATPTVPLDVEGAAKITGNLDMSSSGQIVNLVNPTNAQDAATRNYVDTKFNNVLTPINSNDAANKAYVDTKTTDMATSSSVSSAITTALGSSGTQENRPTVQRDDTTNGGYYLTFINSADTGLDGSTKRALMRCDSNLYYNPSTNTLVAETFNGYASSAGTASYAGAAINNKPFRIGNNVNTEPSIRYEHYETIALVVKALSNARSNRPVNDWTSYGLGSEYFSTIGLGYGANNDITASSLTTLGGTFVAFFGGIIQVGAVIAGSDKRMKKNITEITDGTKSLQLFRKIKCSTFEYVDKFSHSPYKVHGFIAQDIKDIVPEAVHLVPDYLPNFFCMCFVEKHSIQNNDKTETFRVFIPANDTKKLIFTGNHDIKTGIEYKTVSGAPASDASGNQYFKVKFKDISDNDVEVMTTRIIDDFSFFIEVSLNDKGENTVIKEDTYFLYGQTVDDFHKIDNDHIHNIATAALQEVDRQQQADKARIAELEATVATQQSLINDILERLKSKGM